MFQVAGDFNVQPSRLGGAKDLKPQRDDAIESLLPLRPEDGSLTACVGCNVF